MRMTWIFLLAGIGLTACDNNERSIQSPDHGDGIPKFTSKADQTLHSFESCDAVKDYVAEALIQEYTTAYWAGVPCWSCDVAIEPIGAPMRATLPTASPTTPTDDASPGQPEALAGSGFRRVNDTNTQEEGVDEADLVESSRDGHIMYSLHNSAYGSEQEVLVFETSSAADTAIIARIPLGNERYVSGLYLDEDNRRLIVLAEGGYVFPLASDGVFAPEPGGGYGYGSVVTSFDVSDPRNIDPGQARRFETDAQIIASRRVGGRLHLVSQFGIPLPTTLRTDDSFFTLVYQDYYDALRNGDDDEIARFREEIQTRIQAAVAETDISELLPRNSNSGGDMTPLACESLSAPSVEQRLGLIQVSSMDTDLNNPLTVGLINNGWNVYGSPDSLYVTQSSSGWWFDPDQAQQTAIHRFALSDAGAPAYRGSGLVDGWAHNSYQFSEHAGHLRVASTVQGAAFIGDGDNFRLASKVSVLQLGDDGMQSVGVTPLFGFDEDIRSSRFLGDRGFVVTFRQIDPLFALALDDPANPEIVGELEIPGFSSYIHPLGTDLLLTIGRTPGPEGRGVGNSFQLKLFDVSGAFDGDGNTGLLDLTTHEIALEAGEYAFSTAEYDPLAFNFLRDLSDEFSGILSIPVQIGSLSPERSFSGFYSFSVDGSAGSIETLLNINHAVMDDQNGTGCPGRPQAVDSDAESQPACGDYVPVIYNEPLRTKIIEQAGLMPGSNPQRQLFTFSRTMLKVDTPDPAPLGNGETSLATVHYNPSQ